MYGLLKSSAEQLGHY